MCLHVALSFWRHVCFCRCCQHSEGSHHTTALHLLLEGAFPLFPCQLKATKVLGLNTVCLHYDHSVRLPICWHYCYFLTCTWNALDYQNPETKQNRISTFIWIDFHKPKMKHSVDDVKHTESAFLLIQQALGDATLICKRLWDPAMKEESPTALHSWIDYRSLCTLSKDLRSYSAAESEGLYTCCWVLSLTTVHHTKQVVLHCNVHLLLCDQIIKAKII